MFCVSVILGDGGGCAAGGIVDVLKIQALAERPPARHFALRWVNQSTISDNSFSLYRFLRLVGVVVWHLFFTINQLHMLSILEFNIMTLCGLRGMRMRCGYGSCHYLVQILEALMHSEAACLRPMYVPKCSRESYLWTSLGSRVPRSQGKITVLD